MATRLYREHQVLELIPLGRSTFRRMIQQGKFPKPMKLGRTSVWSDDDVQKFVKKLEGARAINDA